MKNIKIIFLLLLTSFFFTSCLEITEEVSMNADGSGSAVMTVNLSESKDNIKNYMSQEEYQGMKIPKVDEIKEMIAEVETVMRGVSGLSNVESKSNFEDFIFSFSGNFSDLNVLNTAVNTLAKELSKKSPMTQTPVIKDNFSYTKGNFKRHFDYPIDTEMYGKLGFMQQFLLENSRLVGIYRFPTAVKSQSNTNAKLSSSKKSVMLKTNLAQIAKGETSLENTISY